jgi:selenide,water dikinase
LDTVLPRIPRLADENVLVGFDTSADAGVYKLSETCALVQTVDFFTPIVDDPRTFGAIAAANALSDVYAMGGRPLTALAVTCFPQKGDLEELEAILAGGAEKMIEAGCVVLGGHSVKDDEIKFGYAVTGLVHPDRVLTNAGARIGDVLILTKGIGTGVISTALKQGIARQQDIEDSIASMLRLNRSAAEAMVEAGATGCTDVTGFGLIGHAREMALASGVTIEIEATAVPLLPGAAEYAAQGSLPGGLKNNREFASCVVEGGAGVAPELMALLYDPQTAGGLLVSLPADQAGRMPGWRIGRVCERGEKAIRIL